MIILFDYIFYYVWNDRLNDIIIDIDKYNPKGIIILGAEEWEVSNILPVDKFKDIENKLIQNNIKLIFIVGSSNIKFFDRKLIPKTSEIIIWPMFWLYETYYKFKELIFNYENNRNIDKLFISLNNRTHFHRCQLMDILAKYSLLSYGNISFINVLGDEGNHNSYDWKYWKVDRLILDEKYLEMKNQYLIPLEYKTSFINIIAESTIKTQFYTEKTFTAILLCQPFLLWGAPNLNISLKEFGFELYDELFDYNFDKELNDELRLEGLIYNVIKYKDSDYNKLRTIISKKVIKNRNIAIDIIKNEKFIPDIILNLNKRYNKNLNSYEFYDFIKKI